jgi:hypothetical protein
MSRCKSCDVILGPVELKRTNEITGEPEDLCTPCGQIVFMDVNDIYQEQHEYQFGQFTENPLSLAGYDFYSSLESKNNRD